MFREVLPAVPPRIEMEFMGDAARGERAVEGPVAFIKAEVIFTAAIEIDLPLCARGHAARQRKQAFAVQKARSTGRPNTSSKKPSRAPLVITAGGSCKTAALWALTEPKSSGYLSPKCSAPNPPMETPEIPRVARPASMR